MGPSRTARSALGGFSSSEGFLRRLRNLPNQRPKPAKPSTPSVTVVAVTDFVAVGERPPPPSLLSFVGIAAGSVLDVELRFEVGLDVIELEVE